MIADPVRYSPGLEQLRDDEAETSRALCDTFDQILEVTATDYGHAVRGVHAKAHGILIGELRIESGLVPELAQGLFAVPGTHRVAMRLSTNAGDILPDAVSLPRGLAFKVFDVTGERLPGAAGATQDFVMVNGPVFPSRTADQFLGNLKLLAKTTDRMEGAKVALSSVLRGVNTALQSVGIESGTVQSLGGAPNVDPLGETYYSVTPFRYGDYVAKFSLAPLAPELRALEGREIDASDRPNAIRERVQQEMLTIDGTWELRVQLCRDLDAQPIEDPTVAWDEALSPFERVGVITAPRQDSWAADQVREVDEQMRFSVWTGLTAHRPLGNINRARRDAYLHSSDFRARFNGCPIHEPASNA